MYEKLRLDQYMVGIKRELRMTDTVRCEENSLVQVKKAL